MVGISPTEMNTACSGPALPQLADIDIKTLAPQVPKDHKPGKKLKKPGWSPAALGKDTRLHTWIVSLTS